MMAPPSNFGGPGLKCSMTRLQRVLVSTCLLAIFTKDIEGNLASCLEIDALMWRSSSIIAADSRIQETFAAS